MKLRVSSSVAQFRKKAERAWGLQEWEGVDDPDQEILFFGLFHDRDFEVFHNFKGKKSVFWCGGDILRLTEDYERRRVMKIAPETIHYCETEEQAIKLRSAGLNPTIIPSFLGNIYHYPSSFTVPEDGKWKIWMCGHERREQEYGFDQAKELAKMFDDIEVHFYGVRKEYEGKVVTELDSLTNVFYHGQVPEEEFDEDIKKYHCGLRPNENDGVSEVVIKSLLLGQYPISKLPYEGVWQYKSFGELAELVVKLKEQRQENVRVRTMWIKKLNQFPWCKKDFYESDKV